MYQPGPSLTFANARAALAAGLKEIEAGETAFDLSAVTDVDSTAVAALLAWQRAARARGAVLSVVNAPANLTSLAQLYGVAQLLPD